MCLHANETNIHTRRVLRDGLEQIGDGGFFPTGALATRVGVAGAVVLKKVSSVAVLNAETELVRAQRKREFWEGFWRSVAVVVPSASKYGCIAWGASKAAQVLVAWTGSDTRANVKLDVVLEVLTEKWLEITLPWAMAIVLFLLLKRERSLKEKAISRLGEVNRKYELLSDPKRSSSRLPASGKTNPRDPP